MRAATIRGAEAETRGAKPPQAKRHPESSPVLWWVAIAGAMLLSLGLNLWGIDHGLPRVYNPDEKLHFVPKAVGFVASGSLDPDYYVNPPGFSYVLCGVFWLWFGGAKDLLSADWPELFLVGRVTAAVLGSISVLFIFLVGRRIFDRQVGLVSAVLLAVAFLPVYQAKIAVNDVPSVVPVAVALFGAGGIVRWGGRRDYVIAGAGLGIAIGIKYTAGMVLVALLAGAAVDLRRRGTQALPFIALGALGAVGAFALTTPISVLDPQKYFSSLLGTFKVTPPGEVKLGQGEVNGLLHYLWVFSWGFGWLPSLTAIGGAFVLVRRNLPLAAVLIPAPVLYVVFMAMRNVYVSRYMLPVFPFVALLAGYGLCTLVPAVFRRHRRLVAPVLVIAVIGVTLQSVIHDVHVGRVHSRPNTREVALNWMVDNIPHDAKVAIEPMYMRPELPGTGNINALRNDITPWQLVPWPRPDLTELRPGLLDTLARRGVCWVVTGTTQEAIARQEPERLPGAIAFYEALERREELMHRIDPFEPGSEPVPFNFDWAINYYPLEYEQPGPEIHVYRLQHKACG